MLANMAMHGHIRGMDVPVHKAKTDLTKLLPLVEAGERVVITRHGKPVAEIVRPQSRRNHFSLARAETMLRERGFEPGGRSGLPADFDEPTPDAWWNTPIFPDEGEAGR